MASWNCTSRYSLTDQEAITDETIANNKGQAQSFMTNKINEAMNGSGADDLENLNIEITKNG